MPVSRLTLLLSFGFLLCSPLHAPAQPTTAARTYRVLLVGNSLTYANNLPALLRAVGLSQGTPITTETYAAPSGTLAQRLHDGHAADALRQRSYDVVVLQEIGGQLACLAIPSQQRKAPCAASMHAHQEFAKLVDANGAKLLLFTTWAKDDREQRRINGGMRMVAKETKGTVFNAAGVIAALHKTQPAIPSYPDGMHPSTQSSLMLALALYRDISGNAPIAADLKITAPLLPPNTAVSADMALESQPGLAGDGKVTTIPVGLIEPMVRALPPPGSAEMDPPGRRR